MYVTNDFKVLLSRDDTFVDDLQRSSWIPGNSKQEYMKDVSRRCKIQNGSEIRTDTEENFKKDLISSGFVIKIEIQ